MESSLSLGQSPPGGSPTLIRMPAMRTLYMKIRNSGIKNYIVRSIIRSADPVNHKKSISDISKAVGQDNIS